MKPHRGTFSIERAVTKHAWVTFQSEDSKREWTSDRVAGGAFLVKAGPDMWQGYDNQKEVIIDGRPPNIELLVMSDEQPFCVSTAKGFINIRPERVAVLSGERLSAEKGRLATPLQSRFVDLTF